MVRADLPEVRAVVLVHVALAVLEQDEVVDEGIVAIGPGGHNLDE